MFKFTITDEPFAMGYLDEKSDSIYIKTGQAFLRLAKEMELHFHEDLGLPYSRVPGIGCAYNYNSGETASTYYLDQKIAACPEKAAEYEAIKALMRHVDVELLLQDEWTKTERAIREARGGWGGEWGGHSVPDLIDFARYGTRALREKVLFYKDQNADVADFYEGILLTLDAVEILGERFAEKAAELALQREGKVRDKLERLAEALKHCPKEPANNFIQACSVYIMIFSLDGIDSPGHFDWYMIDFWKQSAYGEAREMLEDVWQFFHRTRTWNLCIGGSDENWEDRTNDLTYEILDVAAQFKYNTPNLTMRCHRNTPKKLLRAAIKTMAAGIGMPALYNDEAVCPALIRLGISPKDAHEYVMNGCNQIDIQGKSHMGLEDGEVNLGMAVELALNNGVCRKTGEKIGLVTGEPSSFVSFEEFYEAVKVQIRHLTDRVCNMSNKAQRMHARLSANPIRSLTTAGCLEKGRDYKNGGPLYGHGQVLAEGVPDAIDSVAAVKKYIFEEKKWSMKELVDALDANFEGYEEMYQILRRSDLRWGNDNDFVDHIAKDLMDTYNRYLLTKPTVRGGFFGGGCSPFNRAAGNGLAVSALPNGKRAGETLYGDSIGALPGRDEKGPTALLASCLKLDHTLPTSGFILNIKFDKKLFNAQRGQEAFLALLQAYFGNKGQQLSVTVVNREELVDAMENPEEHRDLIVRVGGYSDYFVNLIRPLQENVLFRTGYEL